MNINSEHIRSGFLQDVESLDESNNYIEISQDNNNKYFQNSISENNDQENIKFNYKIKKIICKECNNFPKIYLNDDRYTIKIICNCKEYDNMGLNYFKENFIIEEEEEENVNDKNKIKFDNYCKCEKHLDNKFSYFCDDCEGNLCPECYTENNSHLMHTVINFNGNEPSKIFSEIKKKLEDLDDLNSSKIQESEKEKKYYYFLEIIRLILEVYEKYPCYNLYRCNSNIYNSLKKGNKDNNQIIIHDKVMKVYFKVRLLKELKKVFEKNKNGDALKTIRINKKCFDCLDILSNNNFKNLIQLELSDNNLKDLTPLLKSKFPVLEELNLSMNKINDENANKLFKINMPNISYINLYYNDLKKYDIFKNFHVFKKLTKLFAGLNKFNKELSEIDENTIYDCSTIEEIGLTKGVFSDESIDLISKFKFENLKYLYLSCNNLSSLSFVDKINCKIENLEEIWLTSNDISDFYPLIKFNNLKKIILKDNIISNINKLVDFVKHFNGLKKIDFTENEIDKNNKYNAEIIENSIFKGSKTFQQDLSEETIDEKIIEKIDIKI